MLVRLPCHVLICLADASRKLKQARNIPKETNPVKNRNFLSSLNSVLNVFIDSCNSCTHWQCSWGNSASSGIWIHVSKGGISAKIRHCCVPWRYYGRVFGVSNDGSLEPSFCLKLGVSVRGSTQRSSVTHRVSASYSFFSTFFLFFARLHGKNHPWNVGYRHKLKRW